MANGRIDDLIDYTAIKDQFKKVFDLMDEMARRIAALNAAGASINLNGRGGRGGGSGNNNNNSTAQATQQLSALDRAIERLIQAESDLGRNIAIVNEATRQQGLANSQNARLTLAQAGSLNELRARLTAATTAFDNMSSAERRNAAVGGATLQNIRGLQREVRALEEQTGRFQRNVGNYPTQLVGGISGFLGAFGLATGGAAIAKGVFDTTVQVDSLNSALKAVSKTEAEYAINQQFLIDTSERLGLNILDLSQSYKLFYAASTQAGLSADTTRKIFNSVAETAATLKLSTADTQGVLLAFSQILGKGKVQAEELRGQIGERLPGAFSIAAKSIGVTEQQLNKMLEKGEVIAADFLPKFAAELEKTFGVDGEKKVEGLQASINRLSNEFTKLVQDNQSGLSQFFTSIVNGARSFVVAFNDAIPSVQRLFEILNTPLPKLFSREQTDYKANFLKEVEEVKSRNDAIIKDFISKDKDAQLKLAQQYIAIAKGSAARYNEIVDEFGKHSFNAKEEAKKLAQEADLIARVNKILRKPSETEAVAPVKSQTQAEISKASRLRELQLKAGLELRKIDLQSAIDSQKQIIDNEKASLEERLTALDNYNSLREILLNESAAAEKKVLEENIKQGQAVGEQREVIEKKTAADRIKIIQDSGKLMQSILKDNADKELKTITDANALATTKLESDSLAELEQARKLYDDQTISLEQYEALKLQIQNKYNILALQQEIEFTRQVIELRKKRGEDTSDAERTILDLNNKINKLGLDFFAKNEKDKTKTLEDELKEREKIQKAYEERIKDLRTEVSNAVFTILTARFENEKNIIQDQIDLINTRKDAEIKAVSESAASEQEKADRVAIINARAQSDTERLNQRKRQVEQQQARFERAKSVASIVANTASAIIKTFADFPYPVALPISLIIGATGAAQLATVLAQPIPRYKDGRMDGPAEWAYTGDGGRHEVVETDHGAYLTPDTATLTFLPRGAKVHKSTDDYINSIGRAAFGRVPSMEVAADGMLKVRQQLSRQTGELVKAMEKNKSVMVVKNTWAGVMVSENRASGLNYYLGKNVIS